MCSVSDFFTFNTYSILDLIHTVAASQCAILRALAMFWARDAAFEFQALIKQILVFFKNNRGTRCYLIEKINVLFR